MIAPSARCPSPSRHRGISWCLPFALIGLIVGGCGAPTGPQPLRIWLTGYSWQDNNPPGSGTISHPILHRTAGGQGTYDDPITVAVSGDRTNMSVPPGTRFYLPTLARYVIVEDNGASPVPARDDTHLDLWIDGQDGTKAADHFCALRITGTRVPAELNPPPGHPVTPGPIFTHGVCTAPPLPADYR